MKFSKMHGIGNDYVYVNCFSETVENPEEVSKLISDRRFGIGSDGLIMIMPSEKADFRMRMFNADGSEGMMCGNGIRCVGKYVYDNKMTDKKDISVETLGGIKFLSLNTENGKVRSVSVNMGKAILKPAEIPVNLAGENIVSRSIEIDGKVWKITCVSMGNPHAVVFVDDPYKIDIEKTGPLFENNEIFPERVNTEFIKVTDEHRLIMRVWERGSGETHACGTGACASVVAAVLNGYCRYNEKIKVDLRGGSLDITYKSDGTVIMDGTATHVFDGEINLTELGVKENG
ncbi:MAG: diaminopimelate epimerase [Oscillospiraceae bacterium]